MLPRFYGEEKELDGIEEGPKTEMEARVGVSTTQQPEEGRTDAPCIPGLTFDLQPEVKTEPLR